ncbi:CRAL-TRIO domain-containing protein C3H8.02 [Nymphon striatum]|nr:CRAL-TRIO domain-containing protein C3H8.02 [Nymphon striatum]
MASAWPAWFRITVISGAKTVVQKSVSGEATDTVENLISRILPNIEELGIILEYHNDASLKRFLKGFQSTDGAFQAIIKSNKWRKEYGVSELNEDTEVVQKYKKKNIAMLMRHRDMEGRPIIYIPARNHNVHERDIDELTKFIVFILEEACKKCFEDVIDNLCIVFDLKDFSLNSMDYQFVKNLIWLLSKHYPERLGICVITNAPTLFSGCWTVIRGWLSDVTANKVKFVGNEIELCNYLHPEILPENV